MSEAIDLRWNPPGPISDRFMASRGDIQIINGPVGSGKTTTCFMKALALASAQQPSTHARLRLKGEREARPVRKFKLTVMRDDYRQLWRSTIPSWNKRFPQSYGKWTGARNAPATHELTFALPDGTAVEFIAEFVALGDNDIEDFMRGYEPTAFYLNELDLLARDVMQHALFRVGRYPSMDEGGPSWSGILADCNAPVIDSWLYNEIFVGERPEDEEAEAFDLEMVKLFRLPGATDPGAENLHNLPPGYYERQMRLISDKYLIRRMVHNQPAPSRSGKPVHEDFDDFAHVAPAPLRAVEGLPLQIGFDGGLDPAAIIGQKLGTGRWQIIDELVSSHGTGAVQFARMLNEFLHERYPGWHAQRGRGGGPAAADPWGIRRHQFADRPMVRGWCDPATTYGGDDGSQDEADWTWRQLVMHYTGIAILPAPTNNATDRREGLRSVLRQKGGFLLSPTCKMVRAGLAGQFRYRKLQLAREERYTDEVDKNAHSHPCEALEYLMLGGGEMAEVHDRRNQSFATSHLPRSAGDDGWRMGE